MVSKKPSLVREASAQLELALRKYRRAKKEERDLLFLAAAKAFEMVVEYAWKDLKYRVQNEGLDASSPKEAVRQAARLGWIQDPEQWLASIDARNDSVHNYFGIPKSEYMDFAQNFLVLLKPLLR